MASVTPFASRSALIIGEGGFAARSLEKVERVTRVVAVATTDPGLATMARERGLPVLGGRRALERFLSDTPVDYLFSVDNPIVLSAAALSRVRHLAVNWHDSPLPAYGGLNATSWAIAAGETRHASVLHVLEEGIDEGDILVWRDVTIEPDDTAGIVNAKCFSSGLDALDELLAQMVDGAVQRTPQEGTPSYHGFEAVPPRAGLLDPTGSAVEFERWSRALSFGPAVNRFASVRVLVEAGGVRALLRPRRVRFSEVSLEAGRTRRTETSSWLVGFADGTLELSDFRHADGTKAALPDAILTPTRALVAACVEGSASLARHEAHWIRRLRRPRLEWALPAGEPGPAARTRVAVDAAHAPAVFAAYLLRTRRDEGATVGWRVRTEELFFAGCVPLVLPALGDRDLAGYRTAFDRARARVRRRGTYALDATARWRLSPGRPWSVEIAVGVEPSPTADLALHVESDNVLVSSPSGRHASALPRVAAQLTRLAQSERRLSESDLFTDEDAARDARGLVGAPLTLDPRTVAARFEATARDAAGSIAIRCEDREISYRTLLADVARVAARLDVEPGSRVALHALPPYENVVASLATLFCRAAYVPLGDDPKRASLVLSEADAAFEITPAWLAQALGSEPAELPSGPTLQDPAYVIFTSGTTGRPKGVVIHHANLAAQLDSRRACFGGDPQRFLSLHSPSFDSFVAGFYWTLCSGGTLVLATEEERHDPFEVSRLIRAHAVTHLDVPPALYSELLTMAELDLGPAEVVIVGGEACPPQLVRQHHERAPRAHLYNEYGPTEATVFATLYDVPATACAPIPIGRPIAGVTACVVDAELRPLPPGFVGELIVAGPTVAAGYFERPEQTAQRFVDDPRGGGSAYRTGDQVRLNDDDQLEWIGRIDGQVQVRGYRVELSAIESALESLEGVAQAAAALVEDGPVPRLCAFVVAATGAQLDDSALRSELSERVPSYCLPDHIEQIGQIPRTSAGKIDRTSLRPRRVEPSPQAGPRAGPIARLMGEVLGRGPLAGDDDFFERGGNSFLAIRLVRRIEEELGVRVPIVDLFRSPTPEGLVARAAVSDASGPRYLDLIKQRAGEQVVFVGSPAQARALAHHLEWGVTGLNVFGMPDAWIESGDLREVAEAFSEELIEHCKDSPVVLTGFCDDTKVAAEMLPRLLAADLDVRGFVAIDGGWMLGPSLRKARRERLFRALRALSNDRPQLALNARRWVQDRVDALRVRLGSRRYEKAAAAADDLARDQALARAYVEAQARYARRFEDEAIVLLSRTYKADHPPPNLDVRRLPVDHATLFLEPQVQLLASAVQRAVAESFASVRT